MAKTDSTLDNLWQSTTNAPPDTTPATDDVATVPPPTTDDTLTRRMGAIEGSVAALVGMMQAMAVRGNVPADAGKPAESTSTSWQDKDFLTSTDVQAMLDSQEPHKAFNRAINAAVKTVYEDMTGRLGNLNRELGGRLEAQANAYVAVESQRRQESAWQEFFAGYPDLSEFRDMAELEALRLAREYQASPYMTAGLTKDKVWGEVANRVRGKLNKIRGEGTSQEEGQDQSTFAPLSPQTRKSSTFMERGGATRAQPTRAKPRPGSPEAMLATMDDHIRQG